MPELPDLEVFAENLTKLFKGKVLERVEVKIHNPHAHKSPDGAEIIVDKKGSRKTYYTNEQRLFD